MNLTTLINFRLLAIASVPSALPLVPSKFKMDKMDAVKQLELLDGAGADQANVAYEGMRSIAASTTVSMDFASGGGLVDSWGTALAMARIKAVYVENLGTSSQASLVLAGSNGLVTSGGQTLLPGQALMNATGSQAGWPTAAGAGVISIQNADGALTGAYRIVAIGAAT